MTSSVQTVAMLLANGFNEQEFIAAQKALREMGIAMKVISANQGLVNGWEGTGWGHNYAVDEPLNTALGADYDAVIIPGGERSHDKLKQTAHTKRFISSMMMANKPVAAIGDALTLLGETGQIDNRTVGGSIAMKAMVSQAAGIWSDEAVTVDNCLLTGNWSDEYKAAMENLMTQCDDMKEAA